MTFTVAIPEITGSLTLDTSVTVTLDAGEEVWYSFTAPADGKYVFATADEPNNYYRTMYLYSSSYSLLVGNTWLSNGSSLQYSYDLSAGETYYLSTSYSYESYSGSYTITVHKAMDTPEITLSATSLEYGGELIITWPAVEHADYYYVNINGSGYYYKPEDAQCEYTYICTKPGENTVFV